MSERRRGFMINEAVAAMNFEHHLRYLGRERDRRVARKKQKNSPSAVTERTKGKNKTCNNYNLKCENCQAGGGMHNDQ